MARVLVVEDEAVVATGMVDALTEHGHEVCGVAADGPTAIRLALENRPDVAFVDVTLARGTDGISTAAELTGRLGTPVVFVTANRHMLRQETSALAVLEKPVSGDDLAAAVDAAMGARRPPPVTSRSSGERRGRPAPAGAARRQLAEGEARFRAVFEHAPHGLAIVDLDGYVIDANGALDRIVGGGGVIGAMVDSLPFVDARAARALDACLAGDGDELAASEAESVCRDGRRRSMLTHGRLVRDDAGQPRFAVLHVQDVTETRRLEGELRRLAWSDPLTGLANRTRFLDRLDEARARHHRGLANVALLLIDLDDFKEINDTHGHLAGDAVLRMVAARLRERLRQTDFAARLGGDEFAAVVETADANGASVVAYDIRRHLRRGLTYEGRRLEVNASIGVTFCAVGDRGPDDVIRRADAALYAAKARRDGSIEMAAAAGAVDDRG